MNESIIKKLFNADLLNYPVKTDKLGSVPYVNLDNAATTPAFAVVEKSVTDYLKSYGSVHRGAGTKSKISTDIYEHSRDVIRQFVNAPSDAYVIFSGNTTGAMNMAAHFFSLLEGKVMVSAIEHSSSWLPWIIAEGERALNIQAKSLPELANQTKLVQTLGRERVLQYDINENFEFDLVDIKNLLQNNKIKALVVTAASNLTGYCPDLKKIGELAHRYGAYYIVDACQFIQHHPLDMQELGIDFLAASGHKFYAPFGGGFLIGPKKFLDHFLPYQIGGGNLPYITAEGEFLRYENQLAHDPGTPNAVGAIAMTAALNELTRLDLNQVAEYETALTRRAYEALAVNPRVELYVPSAHLNTVIPFNIKGIDGREVAERLNRDYGIGVRAGSFCVYHLLRRLLKIYDESAIVAKVKAGDKNAVPAIVRASFGLQNTETDVDRFIQAITEITK